MGSATLGWRSCFLGHGQPTMPLDLSALAPGTYTVVVQYTHGTSASRVVVE